MMTRDEHSRRVKRNKAIKQGGVLVILSLFIVLSIQSYIDAKNSDIKILSTWYECKPNACDYKVRIANTTSLRKSIFLRVVAYYRKSHPEGSDTYPVVNSKRVEVNLKQSEEIELDGSIKVPLKAHIVKFYVGSI